MMAFLFIILISIVGGFAIVQFKSPPKIKPHKTVSVMSAWMNDQGPIGLEVVDAKHLEPQWSEGKTVVVVKLSDSPIPTLGEVPRTLARWAGMAPQALNFGCGRLVSLSTDKTTVGFTFSRPAEAMLFRLSYQ